MGLINGHIKSEMLGRYDMTADNKFIIRVGIPDAKALFADYDNSVSFYKKDLNDKFVEYLHECVEEIGLDNDFIMHMDLPDHEKLSIGENEIIYSIRGYFKYLVTHCEKEIKHISARMMFHGAVALIALVFALMASGFMDNAKESFYHIMTFGISAGIWVLVLTGFSRFLFRLRTQFNLIRIYRRLINIPVEFNYS